MKGFVNGIDWINAEAMKYWSFPASYTDEKKKTEVHNAIFGGDYFGALKVDGYYQRLIKDEDGNCFMIARSKGVNGAIDKYEWVPQLHPFMESLPNGTVLLCECYLPGNEGSNKITSLLGCLKEKCIARQEAGQKLHFYIFDVCAWNGENFIKKPAEERFESVSNLQQLYTVWLSDVNCGINCDVIEFAQYYRGPELWDKLQEYLASGREGIVITRKDCPIYFKRTPAHMTIKIKKELQETIDVVILGANAPTRLYGGKEIETWKYWEDTFTGEKLNGEFYKDYYNGKSIEPVTKAYFNKWAGSLIIGIRKDDKLIPIGSLSGLEEEVLANWQDYKGKVVEVTAMQIMNTENQGLRHPKLVRMRPDLTPRDTDYYRFFT